MRRSPSRGPRLDNLKRAAQQEGYASYRAWAAHLGISPSMLCYVVTGRRQIGGKLFLALREKGYFDRYAVNWLLAPTTEPERVPA